MSRKNEQIFVFNIICHIRLLYRTDFGGMISSAAVKKLICGSLCALLCAKNKNRATDKKGVKTTENEKKPIFKSEKIFKRKLNSYFAFCRNDTKERIPNIAGFCRFCEISREDYAALCEFFPKQYDVAESAFIDEALNFGQKPINSSVLSFVLNEVNRPIENPKSEGGGMLIVCEHDAYADGA